MQSAVLVFPGSNCDRDAAVALTAITGKKPYMVWHKDTGMPKVDLVVVPGGFSYGDYLRCGAIASLSPVMQAVKAHAEKGGYVLGICNGFQILTETHMLPGALIRNAGLKFLCKDVFLKPANTNSVFTKRYKKEEVIKIPIAHHEGNYRIDVQDLKKLQDEDRIAFRYCNDEGKITPEACPNGAQENIAGVLNEKKNVLGMMPHPERRADTVTGGIDGRRMFESLLESFG